MGKLGIAGRVLLDRLSCISSCGSAAAAAGSSSCLCFNEQQQQQHDYDYDYEYEVEEDKKPLIMAKEVSAAGRLVRIKDVISSPPTLALHLKPKMVELKVSMHCNGCARRVEKHISKMEGVTSYRVDLETKRVVVIGDIGPFEVLESVSKVKYAEFWEIQTAVLNAF